jgi:hypothetical protein
MHDTISERPIRPLEFKEDVSRSPALWRCETHCFTTPVLLPSDKNIHGNDRRRNLASADTRIILGRIKSHKLLFKGAAFLDKRIHVLMCVRHENVR